MSTYTITIAGQIVASRHSVAEAYAVAQTVADNSVFSGPVEIHDNEGDHLDTVLPRIREVQFTPDEWCLEGEVPYIVGDLEVNGYTRRGTGAILTTEGWRVPSVDVAFLDDSTRTQIERLLALDVEKSLMLA
jgi:hypothetical protein